MVKISSFVIGLILFSLTISVFGTFYMNLNDNYTRSYDNSSFNTLNKLNELNNITEQQKEKTEEITVESGVLDVIGSYFSSAYKALIITKASTDTFYTMTDDAVEQAGKSGIDGLGIFKTALVAIVIVLIFIGVIISAMVKKDV